MNNDFDSIIKKLPEEYVTKMGTEALRKIYNSLIWTTRDDFTAEDMLGWRKYYSIEECCKDLNLKGCESWADIFIYYPTNETLDDNSILISTKDRLH